MVPKAVLMRSGLVSLTTARPVNTAQPRTMVKMDALKAHDMETDVPLSLTDLNIQRMTGVFVYFGEKAAFKLYEVPFRYNACDGCKVKLEWRTVPGKDYFYYHCGDSDDLILKFAKCSPDAGFKPLQEIDEKVSTNNVNAASTNEINTVGRKASIKLPDEPNMPALEDIVYSDMMIDCWRQSLIERSLCLSTTRILRSRNFPDRVYKVEKSLYGLHQAPRAWTASKAEGGWDFYQSRQIMIGSLMYLTSSRPDIMFAVCACARYQVNPKVSHLYAVKRIFRYLKGQPKLGLWYPKDSPFDLVAYTDSDYAGASLDRKSTTGGCQFLGSRLISWQCKKQTVVANSTTKAEYVAASISTCNGIERFSSILMAFLLRYRYDLATNQKFNFSKYIFESMVKNLENVSDNVTMRMSLRDGMTVIENRAATTATSLDAEQDRGNINKTQSKATLNEPSSLGTSSGVIDLEKTKTSQAQEITSLKRRAKRLEKKGGSRTHGLKKIIQVSTYFDVDIDMFGVHDLVGDEVVAESEVDVIVSNTLVELKKVLNAHNQLLIQQLQLLAQDLKLKELLFMKRTNQLHQQFLLNNHHKLRVNKFVEVMDVTLLKKLVEGSEVRAEAEIAKESVQESMTELNTKV
ncbi:hypothetical protein Tco_1522561 [Tanacetum coccineum]